MCAWVKNRNRRPRFTGNPSKRSEAPANAIRRASSAPSYVRVPRNVKAAYEESIVERQDEKKLTSHGGFEGIADKLPTSAESPSRGFWSFDSESLQGKTYWVLWRRYAVCAFVSLIAGILIGRGLKCALDGFAIGASILLVVFACANSDYKQSLQSKDLHAQQEKIVVPVTRNGIGQEDGKPVNASGVGIPFLLPGTEVQYWIAQDACDPSSNDRACAVDNLIRQLVHDLKPGSLNKQKQAARKIGLLTKNKCDNRIGIRIARADAIKPLIALILSPDSKAQQYGVTAILNLSICDENKELIAKSGAIEPLVKALGTGTPTAKENAACALLHLSKIEENKVAIGQLGAILLLVSLLESGRLRGKKDALTALYLLCSAEENKLRAVQAGAMRPLVELMADLGSSLVDKAASVVMRLIGAAEAKAVLVAEGGMPVLVKIVGDGTQRQKEIAVMVLLRLCKDSVAYQTMVVQAGAMRLLVRLTSDLGSSMMDKAAGMVSMLVEAMGTAEARAVVEGEIPMLVEMVKGTQRQKEIAVEVLFQLCNKSVACRTMVVQAGAMRPLVELMVDLGSSIVDKAADVVSMLVEAMGAAEARAAVEGKIPMLVEMVEKGTQRQKEIAVEVLLRLCKDSVPYQTMVVQAGAMRLLVGLTSDLGLSMVDEAAGMVSMLVEAMGAAEARAAVEGEIPMLVEMVEKGTQRQKEIAVEVLFQLCKESVPARTTVVQAGAMRPLVELMADLGSSIVDKAADVVSTLVEAERTAEARTALAKVGGIQVLVNMVRKGTQRQQRIAMEVLLRLCEDNFEYRRKVVQEGAMRLLVELMADPRSSMGDKAAGVVSTLISVAEAREALVEVGGIQVLVKIVKEGTRTQTQKEIAVEVLLQLCEKNVACQLMVVKEKAIRPLAALSKSGTNRGKQTAETLRLLLQRPRSGNAAATTQRY